MKSKVIYIISATLWFGIQTVSAQLDQPYIHDPSTIAACDGKYYTFGTGGGGLVSDDGWHWRDIAVQPVCVPVVVLLQMS